MIFQNRGVDAATETHSVRLRGRIPGSAADLHSALCTLNGHAATYAPYLASVLNGTASEVPIPFDGRVFATSADMLDPTKAPEYAAVLKGFLNVRNSLLAFPTETPLAERVMSCKAPIVAFSEALDAFTKADGAFAGDLSKRVESAARLHALDIPAEKSTFIAALEQCAIERDWESLETIARRYEGNVSEEVRLSSRRHLALALAHSNQPEKRDEGIEIAEALIASAGAEVADFHLCFSVHRNHNNIDRAEAVALTAIDRFETLPTEFSQAAIRFTTDTGRAAIRGRLVDLGGTNT